MKKYWKASGKLAGEELPQEIGQFGKKSEALSALKTWMATHPPHGEYDSAQIVPYTGEGRDWKTLSVRFVFGRKGWRKGEGIR